jgi:hypothetical protein
MDQVKTWFWRTYAQKEIDYVEEVENSYHAFEIKWSQRKALKSPNDFLTAYPNASFEVINRDNYEGFISD